MLKRAIASLSRLHAPSPSPSPPRVVVRRWVSTATAAANGTAAASLPSSSSSTVSNKISPFLVYSEDPSKTSSLSLYSLRDRKTHTINLPKPSHCIGAGYGWLVLSDEVTRDLTLFNPITNQTLPLPKLSTLNNVTPVFNPDHRLIVHRLTLKKTPVTVGLDPNCLPAMLVFRTIVISTNIHSDGHAFEEDVTVFLVLLSPPFGLAYAKPGDDRWIAIDFSEDSMFLDVIFHKKRIFTVMGIDGRICSWKFGGMFPTRPTLTRCRKIKEEEEEACKSAETLEKLIARDLSYFLVKLPTGGLLRVKKERINDDGKVSIKLHKLIRGGKIVKVKSLGENALLLGSNNAICIPAVDVPGLKGNNAYSKDQLSGDDVGVYIMEDESTKPIPLSIPTHPSAAWVMTKLLD